MVQLRILSGKRAGAVQVVKQFPCVIGRSSAADWRMEEPGIWDRHLQLGFQPGEGIIATVLPGAVATINRQPFERAVLHNGDLIEAGAVKLQFWLGETRQRGFQLRETVTWLALGILCLGQVVLIYHLLQ